MMTDQPSLPPEDDAIENEAPPDALPASPGLRRVAIAIYILIVICVVAGLLMGMIAGGLFADRWSIPLPESWSI